MRSKERVASAQTVFEAHMIRGALEQHGIKAEVTGEMLAGLGGAIPIPDAAPQVWVGAEDAPRAREIINELSGANNAGQLSISEIEAGEVSLAEGPSQTCAGCGESNPGHFGQCWSCGDVLTLPSD